jgi:hypothetical protein
MKKIFLFIVVVAFFAMNVSAKEFDPVKPNAELRAELMQMIDLECDYLQLMVNECSADILFTINNHNEIVVISVNSPNPQAENHFASKLNYQKVNPNGYKQGVLYLLPIRITNGS